MWTKLLYLLLNVGLPSSMPWPFYTNYTCSNNYLLKVSEMYKVVQIWPGWFVFKQLCKQSRSYLNHLVLLRDNNKINVCLTDENNFNFVFQFYKKAGWRLQKKKCITSQPLWISASIKMTYISGIRIIYNNTFVGKTDFPSTRWDPKVLRQLL